MANGGKGSDRRPGDGYESGWDRIFGKKRDTSEELVQKSDKQECCNGNCNQGRDCPKRTDWAAA